MNQLSNARPQRSCRLASYTDNPRKVQLSVLYKASLKRHGSHPQRVTVPVRSAVRLHSTSGCRPGKRGNRSQHIRCSAAAGTVDRTLMVKFSLAHTSNQLDLSECGLTSVPQEVLELTNLEVHLGMPTSSTISLVGPANCLCA